MTTLSVSQFRDHIKDIGGRVAYAGERIAIESHNKPYFAVVSCADLELLELLEDKLDLYEALEALKEKGSISLDDFRKELGL